MLALALVVAAVMLVLLWPRGKPPGASRVERADAAASFPHAPATPLPAPGLPEARRAIASSAGRLDDPRPPRQADDAGAPSLFGPLVALGQGFLFGEALNKNAANADAYVDRLCEESAKLRERPPMKTLEGREHDAAQFLADLIDYEKPLDQPTGKRLLSGPSTTADASPQTPSAPRGDPR